jgi:hypothetical protein
MGTHVAAPTPQALWEESCELRHLVPELVKTGDPVAALRAEEMADELLADARLTAVALGLSALVKRPCDIIPKAAHRDTPAPFSFALLEPLLGMAIHP